MKKVLAVFFSFFIFLSFLFTQQVWYFGNGAGLDFSSGSPRSIHDGKIFTLEGCASSCDEKGQLVLYTDGITVWNKFHQEIKNGTELNGSPSSTQSALIVPQPRIKDRYFIFTTDEKAGLKGFCYSIVDLSQGGGSVIKKNIQLLALSAEKITAVKSANGKDVWVITHQWNSNNFCAFPVTEQGVGTPVISSVGVTHAETGAGENRESIGYLRASWDGKKIASAICYRSKSNLEILDFDNSKGQLSNPVSVSLDGYPYGLCFSPGNKRIYISFLKGKSGLVQYDMNTESVTEIASNEKENTYGCLQLGPDGKIYVARTGNLLDVIELPDKTVLLCKYQKNAINLAPGSSNFGLPDFFGYSPSLLPKFSSYVDCGNVIEMPFTNKDKLLMTEISVCVDNYNLSAKNAGASFNWSTLETTQKIQVTFSGLYRVEITKDGCTVTDSIKIHFRKDLSTFSFLPEFNPESEFLNSEFYYEIEEVQGFELNVYDTKKKKVLFFTDNPHKKWNGKNNNGEIVPAGDYYWTVRYTPNCPKGSKPVIKEGVVTVKRKKK